MESYYKPYLSDESDSESESDGYTSEESLVNVPGKKPPVSTGGPFVLSSTATTPTNSGTTFEQEEKRNTSLITINSRDRDTNVYPQPTYFSLRLPRVFKSVKQINLSQLNLLNSFFNFAAVNGNTTLWISEQGRLPIQVRIRDGSYTADDLVNELTSALNATPLFANISLGDFINGFQTTGDFGPLFNIPGTVVFNSMTGTYDTNQTLNDIIARYFVTQQTVGTVSYTYNQSLVAYYYPIMKEMILNGVFFDFTIPDENGNPVFTTRDEAYTYIVFYFTGLSDPKVTILVNDPTNQGYFDAYKAKNTFQTFLVNQYTCSYNTRQGRLVISAPRLNDSIAKDLETQYNFYLGQAILSNSNFTDVNDFLTQYANISNVNNSLIGFYNFIQSRFTSNFGVNFGAYGAEFYADPSSFLTVYNTSNQYGWFPFLTPQVSASTILSNAPTKQIEILWSNIFYSSADEQSFISTSFSTSQLSFSNSGPDTFGYFDVELPIAPTSYQRLLFSSDIRRNVNIMTIPRYSTNYTSTNDMVFDLNPSTTPKLYTYEITGTGSTLSWVLTDISGNTLFNLYNIQQTMLESEDFMRIEDKWLTYMTPQILAGIRIQPTNPNFNQYPPKQDIALTSFRPFIFFEVAADNYLVEPRAHFNVTFHVETQDGTPFPVPITVSWYKDRAVFMADALGDIQGSLSQENPFHYFKRQTYSNTNSAQMIVDVNNLQHTFFHVHFASDDNIVASIPLRVFCVLTEPYGTYRIADRIDYFDLPFRQSTLVDQITPASQQFESPLKSIFDPAITQIGYDISGVSNNLMDYFIDSGNNNHYDPLEIDDYRSPTQTGLRYQFNLLSPGASQPPPQVTNWSLYFDSNSRNVIRDTYNTDSNIYLSSNTPLKPLQSGTTNEFTMANWWTQFGLYGQQGCNVENYWSPASSIDGVINYTQYIGDPSIFLSCSNFDRSLITDAIGGPIDLSGALYEDLSGFSGFNFWLPPGELVKVKDYVLKFAYTQPSLDTDFSTFTRDNTPLRFTGILNNGLQYRNQTTPTQEQLYNDWDDWFIPNRKNTKVGLFKTSDVANQSISSIQLSNAILSLSLKEVTQIGNFQAGFGTLRTREPDWGTYYHYTLEETSSQIWDIGPNVWSTGVTSTFYQRNFEADIMPTFIQGASTYKGYFLTEPNVYNYSYLPKSFGLNPSVVNATYFPDVISTIEADIPNSYMMIPFYFDSNTSSYQVGCFHGVLFTYYPALPSTNLAGAAPYYGPLGGSGWWNENQELRVMLYSTYGYCPMYYNGKLAWEQLSIDYNPAADLSVFGGFDGISGEFQNTVMFVYKNEFDRQDIGDVSTVTELGAPLWKWGQESNTNYMAYDSNSGYNNLSYIQNIGLIKGGDYAIHVRSYDPINSFTSGVRFIGKNLTDFGTVGLADLANEISSLNGYSPITDEQGSQYSLEVQYIYGSSINYNNAVSTNNNIRLSNGLTEYSFGYANALMTFDTTFSTTVTFGRTQIFNGLTYTFNGYQEAISTYISEFFNTRSLLSTYTNTLSTAYSELSAYVVTRYGDILPSSVLNRNRYTDPLPFSLLFSTYLSSPYKFQFDEWGLGYNLGFKKTDTALATTVTSDTFIRIVQNYIYLRISPEFNTNTMATSGKESLADCRDSAGEDAKYFSKILLNNFGSFSQTAVQRPKEFNPVLGKYETVTCQLTDKFGNQISSLDCEYDFVIQIDEITNGPKDSSSLLGPTSDLNIYKSAR